MTSKPTGGGPERLFNKAVKARKAKAKKGRRPMIGAMSRRTHDALRLHRDGAAEGSSRGL